jgi:hypothetical protein
MITMAVVDGGDVAGVDGRGDHGHHAVGVLRGEARPPGGQARHHPGQRPSSRPAHTIPFPTLSPGLTSACQYRGPSFPVPRVPLTPARDPQAIAALNASLLVDPKHPLALHLTIHILEPSSRPIAAVQAADQLRDLVTPAWGVGHLVHMPGHIYARVGRYHDASQVGGARGVAREFSWSFCHALSHNSAVCPEAVGE